MSTTENPVEARRHELFADVAEQIAQHAIHKHGYEEDKAIDLGNFLADHLAQHWKGQNIYIGGDRPYKLNLRDWEIFNKMGRGNAHELAREYGLSYVRIHQIYRRCLQEYRARVQGGLFESPEPPAAEAVIHRAKTGV